MRTQSDIIISTIIATIGRATLARAVESILAQDCPFEFEVIIVNDSGRSLPVEDWQRSSRVTILNTNKRERCFGRNAGASIARGKYLHFLDDDDWMLPGAFKELLAVSNGKHAALIYGRTQFVDKDEKPTWEFHPNVDGDAFVQVMTGKWVPLQSSLIKANCFFGAGGFDYRLVGLEQKDLTRRVALLGPFVGTDHFVSCVVQDRINSTSDHRMSAKYSVWSRDNILEEDGTFARMRASAKNPYWRGKMVRAYVTCVAWNIKKRNISRTLSRAVDAAAAFIFAIFNAGYPSFWHGILGH